MGRLLCNIDYLIVNMKYSYLMRKVIFKLTITHNLLTPLGWCRDLCQ